MTLLDQLLNYMASEWKSAPFVTFVTTVIVGLLTAIHPGFTPTQLQQSIIIIVAFAGVTLVSLLYTHLSHKTRQTVINAISEVQKVANAAGIPTPTGLPVISNTPPGPTTTTSS